MPDPPSRPPKPAEPSPGGFDEAAAQAPMHGNDQAPSFVLRGQAWVYRWLSSQSRVVLGLVIVILAVVAAVALSSSKLLRIFFEGLDVLALAALFLVNWLGNGGALVPIPGARFVGLLLVFNQAVVLPSLQVFTVAAAGMALGLLSYYIAGARTAASYAEGDAVGAEDLARETGMLGDDSYDFSPGADLDAQTVEAIAGVSPEPAPPPSSSDAAGTRSGGLRSRFRSSLQQAQARAKPVIEQRGTGGMFLLCFAPTPMGTAAAYLGGLMRFGFSRYLLASFVAKFLLTGIIVLLALIFSDAARAVDVPEIYVPILDVTIFGDGPPNLPVLASPSPSVEPVD